MRDVREELVEACANFLAIILNYALPSSNPPGHGSTPLSDEPVSPAMQVQRETGMVNLFAAYVSRLHQIEVCYVMTYYKVARIVVYRI